MSYAYVPDEENGLSSALFDKSGPSIEFAEQEVRLGFVRKVFGECSALCVSCSSNLPCCPVGLAPLDQGQV
jgi:hypothetical protein